MSTATKSKPSSTATPVAPEAPEEQPIFGIYEELVAELEAAKARITELESSGEQLNQILWLQKTPPKGSRRGFTDGGTPFIEFGAQFATFNKKTNSRVFGARKFFTAYGELAETIGEFFNTDDRLVRITAYERPWHGTVAGPEGPVSTRNTEWIVVSFQSVARLDNPAPMSEPEAPFSGEPTSEEVPF
jgi:hypothetical protein